MKPNIENIFVIKQNPERDLDELFVAMGLHDSLSRMIDCVKGLGTYGISAKSHVEKELNKIQIEFDKTVPQHFRCKMTSTVFYQLLGIDPLGDLKTKIKPQEKIQPDGSRFIIAQEVEAKMLMFDYYEEVAKVLKKFNLGKSL